MSETSGLKRLLILDDDSDFRKLVRTFLEKSLPGIEVTELDPLSQKMPDMRFDWSRYDLLLLDYNLDNGGISGLDILHNNRKNPNFPATIMLTGAGNEEVAVRALKYGVHDYLRKTQLEKKQLHQSIINSWEKHKAERERINELTNQSHAFNKALFYQQLEHADHEDSESNRILLLITLDNHANLDKQAGIIIRDNIIRHIAKKSFDVFKLGNCNPSITRFSDASVGLIIDAPKNRQTLDFNLEGMCNYLGKNPYQYKDKKYQYTVSIGVVPLIDANRNAEILLRLAIASCREAANTAGNSYYVYNDKESKSTATDPDAAGGSPADTTTVTKRAAAAQPVKENSTQKTDASPPVLNEQNNPARKSVNTGPYTFRVKEAIDEKRVLQTFQPAILISGENLPTDTLIYSVSMKMIDTDGSDIAPNKIREILKDATIKQYIDRWMLREIFGKIATENNNKNLYIIKISEASLADTTLFNWLRSVLAGVENSDIPQSVALEISSTDMALKEKPTAALISYLHKNHGFKFVLGCESDITDHKHIFEKTGIDMVRIDQKILQQLGGPTISGKDTIIDHLKAKAVPVIADNILDAAALTHAIACGADYASGDFVGEASDQLYENSQIESLEIN